MTYTLYGDLRSGSVIIEAALALIGAPVRFERVSLRTSDQRSAAFAALNPRMKIPVLATNGGEVLTESAAILLSLDERHPGVLLPAPATPARAVALRWLLFMATELYPLVELDDYPERFCDDPDARAALRARVAGHWRERLSLIEQAIAGDPWFLAGGLSAVDLYLSVVSRWVIEPSWRAEHAPKVEAIAAAVAAHPALAPVWRRFAEG